MSENIATALKPDHAMLIANPLFIRRLVAGMAVTVGLAGPTLVALMIASQVLMNWVEGSSIRPLWILSLAGAVTVLVLIYGIWHSLAAVLVHTAAMALLARKGIASPWIAAGLGCAIFAALPFVTELLNALTNEGGKHGNIVGSGESRFWPSYALTGALLGWLNWWIGVRPRRFLIAHEKAKAAAILDLLRAVAGIAATTLAAGPTLGLLLFGGLVASPAGPMIIAASAFVGMLVSMPLSVANAAILFVLARCGADALPISALSGSAFGLVALSTLSGRKAGVISLEEFLMYVGTGVLMGGLFWLIAILPQRLRRLASEKADTRDLDSASMEGKHVRRVPWDGRAPPH